MYAQREPIRFPVISANFENASEAFVRDGSLVIILGDRQPVAEVTRHSPSGGVPIHVLSRDMNFVKACMARGYERGMWPRIEGSHPGMETFLAGFLGDFSTAPTSN